MSLADVDVDAGGASSAGSASPQLTLSCRECRTIGVPVALDATVRGIALPAVSRLPRCLCHLRKGKVPAGLPSLLAGAPALDDVLGSLDRCEQLPVPPSASVPPPSCCSGSGSGSRVPQPAPVSHAAPLTYDAEKLRDSRELMVYHLECTDEALLGTIVLQVEHKLENVLQMLRDELEVDASKVSRGTMGSNLKVPIHKNQYLKSALQFFPSSRHCLLVMEFAEDGDSED